MNIFSFIMPPPLLIFVYQYNYTGGTKATYTKGVIEKNNQNDIFGKNRTHT